MNHDKTIIGLKRMEKAIVIILPILSGAILGWYIPVLADWVLTLPIVPLEDFISLIASLNHFWVSIVSLILGIIAAIVFIIIVFNETLKVEVSDRMVELIIGEKQDKFEKQQISAIYVEGKQLVILGLSSEEKYREVVESKFDYVKEVFLAYGYPFRNEDPYINYYQRWELGNGDLPSDVNSILYARSRALREDQKKEAKRLREDLAQLGVVIRDEQNSQFIRMVQNK
ncbi:YqeB family protein [Virgibacillus salexigens]|uniref:YqeB family protein n=1 Tax=Virgibacillus TaxID=84406 RepID=UPI00136BBD05|nr:50S ribosomal protein L29 [Virgibacillus massiliensis]MYL43552.1 50S ribosomal protein L29 [Virgibacillus massiliensis]